MYSGSQLNDCYPKRETFPFRRFNLIISIFFFADKPYFLSNPPSVLNVRNGTDAVLNCTVQGYPNPSAWWTTNATLDSARVVNVTTKEEFTGKTIIHTSLTIKNLGEVDFGLYTCHAVEGGNKTAASDTILKVSCKFYFACNFIQ